MLDFAIHTFKRIPYSEAGDICMNIHRDSLLYSTTNRNEIKSITSTLPDARSIKEA